LDDTLFDHTHSSLAGLTALQERFAELGRLSLDQLAKIPAQNPQAMHALVLLGELSLDEARLARFRALPADLGASSLYPGALARRASVPFGSTGPVAIVRRRRRAPKSRVCFLRNPS